MILKNTSKTWCIIFVSLILGTGLGIFFQQFGITSQLFHDFINFKINIEEMNLIFIKFGLLFGIKINLGTIIGGVAGILWAR